MNIRLKLGVYYTSALAAVLMAYAALVYALVAHVLEENLDDLLKEDFEAAVEVLAADDAGQITLVTRKLFNDTTFRDQRRWLEVWSEDGATRLYPQDAGSPDAPPEAPSVRPTTCADRFAPPASMKLGGGAAVRAYCAPFSLGTRHVLIRVSRSESDMRHELQEILWVMALALPVALGLSLLGGLYLAGRALKPIETTLETMRRFTADASHELRTPLTAMISVGEVARMKSRDAEDSGRVIDSMLEEARRMSQLVSSLLTLSRADSGTVTLNREPVDLMGLARDVATSLASVAAARGQQIEVRPAGAGNGGGFHATVDRFVIRQAVVNLIENALKFSPDGATVGVVIAVDAGTATIQVTDHGEGIAAAEFERIFERFYRVDKARSRATGGSGLGLAIVKWAVEAHLGHVQVESMEGRGSTFRIVLPEV